jgi:two-component system sensor histidine kinase/response regulator
MSTTVRATPRKILVVEDSRTQAEALRAQLAANGYDVRVAKSGVEALAELRRWRADLVISDVIMPEMTGLELCRELRRDAALRDLPFILLTSLVNPLDVVRGLECGADNYVTKPYELEQLLNRIQRTLDSRERRNARAPNDGIEISFLGSTFTIHSTREQVLDVLVSSFEDVVRANTALRAAEDERERLFEQEKQARLDAEEAKAKAEEANRAKSEFLAMMSHDLRTPLNAIGGYSELLAMGVRGPVNAAQLSDLERIRRNQRHLLSLVNDVLSFARLETGEIPLHIDRVHLDATVRPLRAVIEPQAHQRGVSYEFVGCAPEIAVMADSERLEQILINLLGNAIKFTPAAGKITVSCASRDGQGVVEVMDTGIGIPASKLSSIFDAFVQVDTNQGRRDGVGLGLAISRKLANAMSGDITVDSVLGEGSTFRLTLPLAG